MSGRKETGHKRKLYVPARYVFLAIRVLDMFLSSFTEGVMPLAITSMVRTTTTTTSDTTTAANVSLTSSDMCPGSPEVTNNSSSSDSKGGDFDWSELTQSYVSNGPTYGSVLTMMLAARLVLLWSPKLMMAAGGILTVALTALTPALAHWDVRALIAARVLLGIPSGINMPAMFALDSTWFPPNERQQMVGVIFGSLNVASIASSSVTGYLIERFGWEDVFYIFAVMKFVGLCLWIFIIHDSPGKHPRISEEEKNYITSTVKKETEVKLQVPWLQIFLSAPVWAYLSVSISNVWIMFLLSVELPTYLTKMLYYSTTDAGYLVSACNAMAFIVQVSSGFLSQWLRGKGYISQLTSYRIFNAVVTLGSAAAIIGITLSGCDTTAIVVLLLFIKGFQSVIIAGSFLNHMDLAINFVPTLSGINGTVSSIVGIISPTIAAAIINNNQTLTAWKEVFYISAIVSAVPYVIFLIFGSVDEQPWNKVPNKDETLDPEEPQVKSKQSSVSSEDVNKT
ncbi:sialin-like [Bacillus rossius redtenbacheri]|uniref:sialin-like n=1 Tax=Bacillus rossius redtenbacheri TaxID=93214 RepID=UPI002FDCECA2